jgi:hypothetical protein
VNEALGARFARALRYAHSVHAGQTRKGTEIPYVAHLLGVASLVIDDGAAAGRLSEDEAIAALLHDAAEDQGGAARLADIRDRFGDRAADIVAACSDTFEIPKPPWRERKQDYLDHLRGESDTGVLRVSLADKLHNARAVLSDYRQIGDLLWSRFHPEADTEWYFRSLAELFAERMPGPLSDELTRTVDELERAIAATPPPIPDSYWVRRGRLLAGEYPGSLDPRSTRRKVEALLDSGVEIFIDLTEEGELDPYATLLAGRAQHRRHPIPDLGVLPAAGVEAILDAIDEQLADRRPVYVHCWGGVGRTGTIVGCHLVRHGHSGDAAIEQIARWRAGTPDGHKASPQTEAQRRMILDWDGP